MRVHYWELSNYNSGNLIGRWFDLDGVSKDDHHEELTAWLEELTEKTGELCEEWILGDVEDVPDSMHWEYGLNDEFFELSEAVENSCNDREVFEAAAAIGIELSEVDDKYRGHFDNDEEFAQDYADNTGMLDAIPDDLRGYFDMASFGRDLSADYSEHDGHYFG